MSAAPARINPFPGLRPFIQEEDYLFFGREEQTLELLQRLASNRFVAVVGTSGSGKSSLVRCGLLSELLGGRMLGAGASWEVAVTHPGGNPLALLTDALLAADLYDRQAEHARENLLATLSRSHFGLVEAVKQADLGAGGAGTNFLLVVDQFEEVFRFHEAGLRQQEAASEFVSLLLEAVAQNQVPIYIVLTMRSDFIGDCGQFEGLAETVNRGEFLIPRLTREQYKRVIEGPIKVAGGQISPRLLQRLLNDLGQQADQLPCLQHALMRTWNVWTDNGNAQALDLEDYQRVGKMTQALSLHADEIYDGLATERQRQLCRGLFQAITVQESENRGIRRPQRLGRLGQILDVPVQELLPIIDAYRQSGVTFLMPAPDVELTDQTIIDISHESLMRVWTRLRHWVEEEAQAAGIYLRLSESAALHAQGKTGLYRDPELGIALAWQQSQHPNAAWAERYRAGFDTAMAFLKSSQDASVAEEQAKESARQRELEQARQLAEAQQLRLEQQQRAARKLRKMIVGLAIVALIAVLACIAALIANRRANTLAGIARQNEEKATQSQHETANALSVVASQKSAVDAALEDERQLQYTTDMQLVPFVWKDGQTTAEQLHLLLAKHIPDSSAAVVKPDLRGFEWYYDQHLLDFSAAVFRVPDAAIVDAVMTPQGQLLTISSKGQLRRWDPDSQIEDETSRRDLPGVRSDQECFLSSDGSRAALVAGHNVYLFDTSTGKETLSIVSANNQCLIAFSRDLRILVIVDDRIRWCKCDTGQVIASVDQKLYGARYASLSADGLTLAVGGYNLAEKGGNNANNSLYRLDMATKKAAMVSGFQIGTISAGALSPDGKWLVVSYWFGGTLYVFNVVNGQVIAMNAMNAAAHASQISSIAFSEDGANLASGDDQGTVKVWTVAHALSSKGTPLRTFKGHQGLVGNIRFSTDGKRLVTISSGRPWGRSDRTARVWDLESTGTASHPLEGCTNPGVARLSPDGLLVASADAGGVHLWDAATGKLVRDLPGNDLSWVHSLAFSPADRRLLAIGAESPTDPSFVALWDIDAGTELARFPGATDIPGFKLVEGAGAVGTMAFSPDGKYLVAGFGGRIGYPSRAAGSYFPLKVWDVATRQLIHRLDGHTFCCTCLDFSRDGKLLASGSFDDKAIVWSTSTWKATQTLATSHAVYSTVFSPDNKTLVVGHDRGDIQWWDIASGRLLQEVNGHATSVQSLVFSPDGLTLASGSEDQTVRLWNTATRRQLMQMDPGDVVLETVQSLDFSPDGRQLLAAGTHGSAIWSAAAIVWNDPEQAAKKLRLLLQSNADFKSRIRMFSENLTLHAALEKLDSNDPRVRAALAAAQANWHASRREWPQAAAAFDQLVVADPVSPDAWLRTPGLLRLATALVHQDRSADAAKVLYGVTKHRSEDGIPSATIVGFGFMDVIAPGDLRVGYVYPGSPASRTPLRAGDAITKVNGVELTKENIPNFNQMVAGEIGTKVRLTVRHLVSEKTEDIVLVKATWSQGDVTGGLLFPLLAPVRQRLAKSPRDAGLLELRAEISAQRGDLDGQVADCTAAIKILAEQPAAAGSALPRLYHRRGDACLSVQKWQQAVDDYNQVITPDTTDVDLLTNRARAHEAMDQRDAAAADWSRAATGNPQGAKWLAEFAHRLADDGQAPLAVVTYTKAVAVSEENLAKQPQNTPLAAELADVLLDRLRPPVGADPLDRDRENKRLAAAKITEPWLRLAVAYALNGRKDLALHYMIPLVQNAEHSETIKPIIDSAASFEILEELARLVPGNAYFQAALARHYSQQGNAPLADAARTRASALFKDKLATEPDDSAAAELTQLLLDGYDKDRANPWVVLKPVQAKSKLGATLSILPDDSILASGPNPSKDRYHVMLTLDRKIDLAAVRMELLTDPSLPGNGPGRQAEGTCALTSWQAIANSPDRTDPIPIEFNNAWADHQLERYPIRPEGQWNIYGAQGGNCTAIWSTSNRVSLPAGATFTFELQCQQYTDTGENLGRFRLSVTGDPDALDLARARFTISKLADPWEKLAATYQLLGDPKALDTLLKHHPAADAGIAELYAAALDWGRAIPELRKLAAEQPTDDALAAKLAAACQSAGAREGIPHLAEQLAADPSDTALALKVAALQAWFGQSKEFAATRQLILASAKNTDDPGTAERAAKACSILPSTNKADIDATLVLGRMAVNIENPGAWNLLALGMAQYRAGNYAAADQALLAAAQSGKDQTSMLGTSAFYRAMSLFRQDKPQEARQLLIATAASMRPLPADENNPLAGGATPDDLIEWLAYKQACTLLKLGPPRAELPKK